MNPSSLTPKWRARIEKHQARLKSHKLRWLFWVLVALAVLPIVAIPILVALINTGSVHAYLIRAIEKQASESLGTQVHIQNFALHLDGLNADVYGVTVAGAAPHAETTLLEVDHLHAGVRITSILHRAWYFDDVQVNRPIVQIVVDKSGASNIPTIKSSSDSSNTSVFDLGIRHALLDRGEVYYNSQPSALSVDLQDVEFKSSFDAPLKQYSGQLSYAKGNLLYGSFQPVEHDLQASFQANPNTFNLNALKLTLGASQLNANAVVNNYSDPDAQGHYDVTIDGKQVASLLNIPSVPTGIVHASGALHYHQAANSPMIDALLVNGDLSSQRLNLKTPSLNAEVTNLNGHYKLANGDLTLSDLVADALGGQIEASGTMADLAGKSHSHVEATVRRVSLASLTRSTGAAKKGLQPALTGELNADAKATWGSSLDDLVANVDATIAGKASHNRATGTRLTAARLGAANNVAADTRSIPISSAVHAVYSAKTGQLKLDKSYLRTERTNISANGTVGERSALGIELEAGDLSEIDRIAAVFQTQPNQNPLGIAGAATFHGNLTGSTATPHLTGRLTGTNLAFNGTVLKSLRTDIDASPSSASLQHAVLVPASHGRVTVDARVGLTKWSFTDLSPVQIDAKVSQLDIADLTKLANQQIPVFGILNADVTLHGTQLHPVGNGNVSLTNLSAYGQPVRTAMLTFNGDGQQAHGDLTIELAAGSIHGTATVRPQDKTYIAEVTSSAIQLDRLEALKARNINITGAATLAAKGQGSFDNPGLESSLLIPSLVVQGQTISEIKLKLNVADHVAKADLSSQAFNTSLQAKATIGLTGDYPTDASLDTRGIPLQPLLATYAPEQAANITGQTEVHATVHGPLKNKDLLEAHVNIPVLKVAYGDSIQLAATSPLRADYQHGRVEIQPSSISGTNTNLHFQGSIPVDGAGPMSLLLQGGVDLKLAQLFDPDVRSSGQIKFNIDSHGAADANDIGGEIDVVDANFASAGLPVGLQHGNGVLKLTKDRINISSFEGTVGGGAVTAQGGVVYRPAVQFNMGVAAKSIRILYPQGMRENVDASLRLSGTTENALLGGSIDLSNLSFAPGFDLNQFIGQFSGGASAPPSAGMAQNVQLNIAVRSSNNVNLVSRTLSVGGSANLQVRGTAADPVILGRVNLTNGDIILNGSRFVLNGGTIQFINPSETQPVVNLSLNTNIQQYSIDLRFRGPVDQLQTEYNSDPALPAADIIHLLAFGNTTEASAQAANSTSTIQTGESLVASQVTSQVSSRVSRIAGISQLSISPVLAGSSSQGPAGAVVTIQQRVTGNLYVNFSTNVASTQGQTIQGQYKISPRVSVSATRDPNGGFGFDTLIKKTW